MIPHVQLSSILVLTIVCISSWSRIAVAVSNNNSCITLADGHRALANLRGSSRHWLEELGHLRNVLLTSGLRRNVERGAEKPVRSNELTFTVTPGAKYQIPLRQVMKSRTRRIVNITSWLCSELRFHGPALQGCYRIGANESLSPEDALTFLAAFDGTVTEMNRSTGRPDLAANVTIGTLRRILSASDELLLPTSVAVAAEDPLDALAIWIRRAKADLGDIIAGQFEVSFPDLDNYGKVAESSIDAINEQIRQLQKELPRLRQRFEGKIEPSLIFLGNVSISVQGELQKISRSLKEDLFSNWSGSLKIVVICAAAILAIAIVRITWRLCLCRNGAKPCWG